MRIKHVVFMAVTVFICCLLPSRVDAVSVEDPPAEYYAPIFITALKATNELEFIELHNDTDKPVDLSEWKLGLFTLNAEVPFCEMLLGGWLLPEGYVVATQDSLFAESTEDIRLHTCANGELIAKIVLSRGTEVQEQISPPTGGAAYVRKSATRAYRTGDFSKDFYNMTHASARKTIYAGEWYEPPAAATLQINEILANARNCSPVEAAGDCGDFVELFNPSTQPIDLSDFRLRNGYQGQNATSSNTYSLSGILLPGQLLALTHDSDGRQLSLTNSGGFVWLEDAFGVHRYDNTIQEYADADSKKGQSWAYDESDGLWKWGTPSPSLANYFPAPMPEKPKAVSSLVPCKPDQYRSEATNRCRNIATATSALAPCKEGQYRSEETNRCRGLASPASLTPCKEGQERNPETNRCRKKAASAIPGSAFAVENMKEAGKSFVGWWALGGIGALAVGRGVWEWRSEMLAGIRKVGSFFTSGK